MSGRPTLTVLLALLIVLCAGVLLSRSATAQATDPYDTQQSGLSSPASKAFAITPANGSDLSVVPRAIYVGTGGDLVVKLRGDSASVTLKNVPSGAVLPVRAIRVYSTSTTATDLVGLY
jgi:hypothetical protein